MPNPMPPLAAVKNEALPDVIPPLAEVNEEAPVSAEVKSSAWSTEPLNVFQGENFLPGVIHIQTRDRRACVAGQGELQKKAVMIRYSH